MKKLLLLAVVLAALAAGWFRFQMGPFNATDTSRILVKVPSGSSVKQVASLLRESGVLKSPLAFEWLVRWQGIESQVQAGKFIVQPSMTVRQLLDVLAHGVGEEVSLTIPEGFTVQDIDALLTEQALIEPGDISRCSRECDFSSFEFLPDPTGLADRGGKLEGYLFPDTYYVNVDEFVPKFFLERMLGTFRKKFTEPNAQRIADSGRSVHELVTMASLIEEETRKDDERTMVSDILWKRFDDGRGLGVDATVRYILDKPTAAITVADLNTNSPYNTRKFRGLPPGPIASPGLKSLQAALNPQANEYWYYLHGNDGQIRYAKTNEEHNINKYRYIRGGTDL